jgi:hypothetical protein
MAFDWNKATGGVTGALKRMNPFSETKINVDTSGQAAAQAGMQESAKKSEAAAAGVATDPNRQAIKTSIDARAPTQVAAPTMIAQPTDVNVQNAGFAGRQMGTPLAGRAAQEQALQMAQDAATGKTPSVAEMQQKKSFEEALASQYAMAASQGANPLAARQAAMNTANLQQQAAQAGGILRAQEQAQARGELAAVGGAMGTQDIQRLSADQQTAINEQAQILTAQGMNQSVALETAKANQSAKLQTDLLQANLTSAEGQQKIDNYLKLQGLNDDMIKFYKGQALTAQMSANDLIKNIETLKSSGQIASQQISQQKVGALFSAAGTIGAGALMATSDERAKTKISEGDARSWVRALGSHEYEYKEGVGEPTGKKFISPMAQEIEKVSPNMIEEVDGIKRVNYGKGFGAMLATMFEMDRDLKALEDSFKKRAKKLDK